jgi:hypothetical protein
MIQMISTPYGVKQLKIADERRNMGWELAQLSFLPHSKVECYVENLTCVGKIFWILCRIFSDCCEPCRNSVGGTAATTRNGTCFDTCLKKDLQAAHAYIFLLVTKSLLKKRQKWGVSQLKAFILTTLLLLLLGTQRNQSSMAKIGYFLPKSAFLHNPKYFLTKS